MTSGGSDVPVAAGAELDKILAWVEDDAVCHHPRSLDRLRWLVRVAYAAQAHLDAVAEVELSGSDQQLDAVDAAEDALRAALGAP